jgi:hypothetical protein
MKGGITEDISVQDVLDSVIIEIVVIFKRPLADEVEEGLFAELELSEALEVVEVCCWKPDAAFKLEWLIVGH